MRCLRRGLPSDGWELILSFTIFLFLFCFAFAFAFDSIYDKEYGTKMSGGLCRLGLDLFHCWGCSATGRFLSLGFLGLWQGLLYLGGHCHFLLWRLLDFRLLFHPCLRSLLYFYLLGHFHRRLYLCFCFHFPIVFLLVCRPCADF